MKLLKIKKFLDKEIRIKKIPDSFVNGLQIATKKNISKIGFAVDACISTFEKAKRKKIDFLITHHGIKRKPKKYSIIAKNLFSFLKKNKLSLYSAHAPLDVHPKYGHNIGLAHMLKLEKIKKFGKYGKFYVGFTGNLSKPMKIQNVASKLNRKLKTKCKVFDLKKKKIKTIAIISGAGAKWMEEAFIKKIDCLITGEIRLGDFRRMHDLKQNIIVAGHYATEKVGLKILEKLIKKNFDIPCIFIDDKTKY